MGFVKRSKLSRARDMALLSYSALCRLSLKCFNQAWDLTHLNSPEVREEDAEWGWKPWQPGGIVEVAGEFLGNSI